MKSCLLAKWRMRLSILIVFAFAVSQGHADTINVRWKDTAHGSMVISAPVLPEFSEQCVRNGLSLEYRFRITLCHRRSLWFDSCENERLQVRRISFNPIDDGYRLVDDVHRDAAEPLEQSFTSLEKALAFAARLGPLSTSDVDPAVTLADLSDAARLWFFRMRVTVSCHGKHIGGLASLPALLGISSRDEQPFDSGWENYNALASE